MSLAPKNKGLVPSSLLPAELVKEIRDMVIEKTEGRRGAAGDPDIIVGNQFSACQGVCYLRAAGPVFHFTHRVANYPTLCSCLVKGNRGEEVVQLPEILDLHRHGLVLGVGRLPKMESRFAAIVVMKMFLGLDVPDVVGTRREYLVRVANQNEGEGAEAQSESKSPADGKESESAEGWNDTPNRSSPPK
ncbi:hypothetical protein F4780DRAFT_197974 [Xylariomycetidae sp. FL0641]|nr:hypothetical protein F4780DRAFT_197974 [Xylariomycetidae sp. FL0641]